MFLPEVLHIFYNVGLLYILYIYIRDYIFVFKEYKSTLCKQKEDYHDAFPIVSIATLQTQHFRLDFPYPRDVA